VPQAVRIAKGFPRCPARPSSPFTLKLRDAFLFLPIWLWGAFCTRLFKGLNIMLAGVLTRVPRRYGWASIPSVLLRRTRARKRGQMPPSARPGVRVVNSSGSLASMHCNIVVFSLWRELHRDVNHAWTDRWLRLTSWKMRRFVFLGDNGYSTSTYVETLIRQRYVYACSV
jgi:hypothetical protein